MDAAAMVKRMRRFLRKYKRLLLLLGIIAGVVFSFFYLRAFFRIGVDWNDTFLLRKKENSSVVYSGTDHWTDIVITVSPLSANEIDVSYRYWGSKVRFYKLNLTEQEKFWRMLTITSKEGAVLFNGKYQKGNSFLYDKNNRPAVSAVDTVPAGVNPYLDFSPNYRRMTGIALGEYDRISGDVWRLVIGLLLIALVIISMKIPAITAKIRHFLAGDQPQHTDLFELAQGGVQLVVLIVAFGFLLAAL